jgi:cystathionine beta-lyase
MREAVSKEQALLFVNSLKLFKIGYSWGGVTSLALAYDFTSYKPRPSYEHRIVRLNIGLEETSDLIADLEDAMRAMKHK